MYDGSALPYEENVANTKKAVAMAREYGANVEAEIGSLGKAEGAGMAHENDPATYTDPSLAGAVRQGYGRRRPGLFLRHRPRYLHRQA